MLVARVRQEPSEHEDQRDPGEERDGLEIVPAAARVLDLGDEVDHGDVKEHAGRDRYEQAKVHLNERARTELGLHQRPPGECDEPTHDGGQRGEQVEGDRSGR